MWDVGAIGFLSVLLAVVAWPLLLDLGLWMFQWSDGIEGLAYVLAGFVAALLVVPFVAATGWFAVRWTVEWRREPAGERKRRLQYASGLTLALWLVAALLSLFWAHVFL